jgi:UDP-N-acetylmuramate: L-alanyl-gamma-D-glutamyl-meso-diaminopimelate ligase
MHIHILGICGTFMGGVAALAKDLGHRVSGSDLMMYPPMSTQLKRLGVHCYQGYDRKNIDDDVDLVVIGNVMSRGDELVEWLLNSDIPYCSGPEWLANFVLKDRWVIALSGTHGKTTTSSMVAWILDYAGLDPGFLIGGVPENFKVSARLGTSNYFVIEADEYDTAFFDKRAKFMHYRPKTLAITNIEYDHADIYPDIDSIIKQFTHLIRTVPSNGMIVINHQDSNVKKVLGSGYWSKVETFSNIQKSANWYGAYDLIGVKSKFSVSRDEQKIAEVSWALLGTHNLENALVAIACATSIGLSVDESIKALSKFKGVKRRLEKKGVFAGVHVFDDFAHHPTAIKHTIEGLKALVGNARLLVALEFRSNSMKNGSHTETLKASLEGADEIHLLIPIGMNWNPREYFSELEYRVYFYDSIESLAKNMADNSKNNDHILIMSNGDFGGLSRLLTQALQSKLPGATS